MRAVEIASVLMASSMIAQSAMAQQSRQIGTWLVDVQKDRFADRDKVVAVTTNGGATLAVRCLPNGLTFAIHPGPRVLRAGDY